MRKSSAALVPALAALALAAAPRSLAYSWPVKPFEREHPIRGNFGDPRTIFAYSLNADGLLGPGEFAFHNGVDVAAAPNTPVYPVMSGTVGVKAPGLVAVESSDGYAFRYEHLQVAVEAGQKVIAHQTILGYVEPAAGHVHLSEIRFGEVQNPLQPGHLGPFRDHVAPHIVAILARDTSGHDLSPIGLYGSIELVAEVDDDQPLRVPGIWGGMPVAPSLVAWKMERLKRLRRRLTLVPLTVVADFRRTLPPNSDFWRIYARGTYQNMPEIGTKIYYGMPGRFLYKLTPKPLDTRKVRNGVYLVSVKAVDERHNVRWATTRISIFNQPARRRVRPLPLPSRPSLPRP